MAGENQEIESKEISTEDRARQLGWHPQDEYMGNPDRWVDAETFIKRGEEELPLLRSNLKKIQADLARDREDFQKAAKEFREFHENAVKKAETDAYEKAKNEIERQKQAALESEDVVAYAKADKAAQELKAPQQHQPVQQQVNPSFESWQKQNSWYQEYPELAVEADNVGFNLWNSGKFQNEAQVYEEVSKSIKRKYPHYFTNPNREAPPAVNEGGEPASARRTKARTFDNLPASAKESCDRMIRMGMIKSREDYAKNYEWDK